MKLRDLIVNKLNAADKLVRGDYPLTHFNVNVFADGNIACDKSSYSTYMQYDEKPLLTVSLKYTKDNEIDAEDFEEQDYDELIASAISEAHRNGSDLDLDDFLEKEI